MWVDICIKMCMLRESGFFGMPSVGLDMQVSLLMQLPMSRGCVADQGGCFCIK